MNITEIIEQNEARILAERDADSICYIGSILTDVEVSFYHRKTHAFSRIVYLSAGMIADLAGGGGPP